MTLTTSPIQSDSNLTFTVKTLFYVSELIMFIKGCSDQFGLTCDMEIFPICQINSLSLIIKVATGERLSMQHKSEGLVCVKGAVVVVVLRAIFI